MSIKDNLIKFVKTIETSDGAKEIVLLLEEWMIRVLQDDARVRKADIVAKLAKDPKQKEESQTN